MGEPSPHAWAWRVMMDGPATHAWAVELDAAEAALADAQLRQFEATREIEKCYSRVSAAMKDRDCWITDQMNAAFRARAKVGQ